MVKIVILSEFIFLFPLMDLPEIANASENKFFVVVSKVNKKLPVKLIHRKTVYSKMQKNLPKFILIG
jgi:hypothetical protein